MPDYECIFENSAVVERYGRLRCIDQAVLRTVAEEVVSVAIRVRSEDRYRILDAGAGTGRFLKPVAIAADSNRHTTELIAVDVSRTMLKALEEDLRPLPEGVNLSCIQADIQEKLSVAEDSVDIVFTAATFHILSRWQAALGHLVELLSPRGAFVFVRENNQFMHETEGFDKDDDFPRINEQLRSFMRFYHEQRETHREPYIASGLRYSDMMPAIDHLAVLGLHEDLSHGRPLTLRWEKPHTYGDILHCFRQRQMTTWGSDLTATSRRHIADALEAWVAEREIDPYQEFDLPTLLILHVFRKPC